MPMPERKPWARSMSTETTWVMDRSSMAMSAGLPFSRLAPYWPISWPAVKLLVAYVRSAVLGGVGTVSSAITSSLCDFAWSRAGFTALPFGVMMMPASPAAIALSMALICVLVSPSLCPAETVSFTPSLAASALALFSIEMKYGLVKFFRISATWTGPVALAVLPAVL